MRGRSPSALNEERYADLSFVSREIERPRERIAEYAQAWRVSESSGIRSEIFYGLFRAGAPAKLAALPYEIAALFESGEDIWRAKLNESIARNFIPAALVREIDALVAELNRGRLGLANQLIGPGRES